MSNTEYKRAQVEVVISKLELRDLIYINYTHLWCTL